MCREKQFYVNVGMLWWLVLTSTAFAKADATAPRTEPAQHPAKQGYVDVPGARLWYWDTGGPGEAVILVHPGTGSGLVWGYQQPVFSKAGYRVIGYSRRGHYRSTITDPGQEEAASADLLRLASSLGVARFHAVGSAAGGIVVTDLAVRHPERLLSATIACSLVGIQDKAYEALGTRLRPAGFERLPPDFRELSPAYRATHPEGTARWLALEQQSRRAASPKEARPASKDAAKPKARSRGKRPAITWSDLRKLRVPVLLIGGDADLYSPPPVLRDIGAVLQDATVRIIEEAGHSAYWEQPTAFNQLVLEFLKQHPALDRMDGRDT